MLAIDVLCITANGKTAVWVLYPGERHFACESRPVAFPSEVWPSSWGWRLTCPGPAVPPRRSRPFLEPTAMAGAPEQLWTTLSSATAVEASNGRYPTGMPRAVASSSRLCPQHTKLCSSLPPPHIQFLSEMWLCCCHLEFAGHCPGTGMACPGRPHSFLVPVGLLPVSSLG